MIELKLFEASPAWTIVEDTLVCYDLSFTKGLRLVGVDTTCQTDAALDELSLALNEALCSVPDGAILRFHSLEICSSDELLTAYRDQFNGHAIGAYVARKKAEQCRAQLSPRRRELFCFVTTAPETRFSAYNPSLLGRVAGKLRRRAEELHVRKIQDVLRLRKSVARALSSAGVASESLGGQQLFEVLWRMANPLRAGRIGVPAYHPETSLRSQLFHSGLLNHFDRFEREDAVNRVLTMKLPPKQVVPTQIRELQYLPFAHHLCVVLKRVGAVEASRRVETNRRQGHELNSVMARLRGARRHAEMPDHQLLQQQADANDVLARLTDGERLYDVAAHLWFAAHDDNELARRTEIALSTFRACGQAEGAIEEMRGRFAFLSMLPGHQILAGERFHSLLASRAADLLPVYGAHQGTRKATTLLSTRAGELVGFHPFDQELPAWNATIAGGTGSGKSFTTRTLLTGWLASGGRAVIATRGRDYHRYTEIFGGRIHDISVGDASLALSPFPTPSSLLAHSHQEMVLEHLASIIGLMVCEPDQSLDRLARRLVHNATRDLYSQLGDTESPPTFVDWLRVLDELGAAEPESAELVARLRKQLLFWIEGPLGEALLRDHTSEDDDRLSVWNLDAIQDADTQGVMLAVLSGVIRRSIAAGPTIVVLDEVWSILKSDAGAALAEVLYRTVRKEGSAIWTISQSMNDYALLPPGAKSAILNNSPVKLFLQHDASDLELVTRTFDLTERERDMLADLRSVPGRYSDLLGLFGHRRQVLRLVPTGIEYWLATSHPADTRWEEMAIKSAPDVPRFELIKRLARGFPNGAIDVDN